MNRKFWTEDHRRKTLTFEDGDTGEEITLRCQYVVCSRCRGEGKHDHPAFSNGITAEEWDRDWDENSREMYVSGSYDVPCEECKGRRVVLEPTWWENPSEELGRFQDQLHDWSEFEIQCAAERRMGA